MDYLTSAEQVITNWSKTTFLEEAENAPMLVTKFWLTNVGLIATDSILSLLPFFFLTKEEPINKFKFSN